MLIVWLEDTKTRFLKEEDRAPLRKFDGAWDKAVAEVRARACHCLLCLRFLYRSQYLNELGCTHQWPSQRTEILLETGSQSTPPAYRSGRSLRPLKHHGCTAPTRAL